MKNVGFTKLDEGILQSSIMSENPSTFKIWIALLASCKENGVAYVSPTFLASVCHMPIKTVLKAIDVLSNPDPLSRSISDDGRRIRKVDGGFEIINYLVYRTLSLKSAEAERKRLYRQERKDCPDTLGRCPDASASASLSSLSLFNEFLKTINPADRELWSKAYPACEIDTEIARAQAWILANPAKGRKSDYRRFFTGWLSRSQDRGGTKKGTVADDDHWDKWAKKMEEKG